MQIDLSSDDLAVLIHALDRHLEEMQEELAHTEAPPLKRSLSADLTRLRTVRAQLDQPGAH